MDLARDGKYFFRRVDLSDNLPAWAVSEKNRSSSDPFAVPAALKWASTSTEIETGRRVGLLRQHSESEE